jgi:hypothetical protein
MLRFRYVRYYTLSGVRDYWLNKADGDVSCCSFPLFNNLLTCYSLLQLDLPLGLFIFTFFTLSKCNNSIIINTLHTQQLYLNVNMLHIFIYPLHSPFFNAFKKYFSVTLRETGKQTDIHKFISR